MRINEQETELILDALTIAANLAHPDAKKQITRTKRRLDEQLASYRMSKAAEEARLDDESIKLQEG